MKKSILLAIVSMIAILVTGCGESATSQEDNGQLKIAMVVAGPMMDAGWNESGYNGLVLAEEELNGVTVYNENTETTDYERVIRDYAKDGYDVVIGHSFEFADAIKSVASEFPDTIFLVTSSDPSAKIGDGKNIGSVLGDGLEQGFLQGAMAAYISETGIIAGVGGIDIPAIKYGLDGYAAGATYINKDIKVLRAVTGSFQDIAKLKEQSLSMIGQGADVVMSNANIAGRGAYEAAKDKNTYAIGSIGGTSDFVEYPDQLVASGEVDMAVSIVNVLKKVKDGTFEAIDYVSGIEEGAVGLSLNKELVEKKFPELPKLMEEISQKLLSGEIKVDDYL